MQTTLLGLGIALILALIAALAGPIFVDWGRYRTTFEAEATRMTGLPVRIGGAIDVRMLPTPSITVRDIEVGARATPVFGAQTARAELSLSSLMRGEWRAAVLSLDGPEFITGLDAAGKLTAQALAPAFDTERVSVDRVVISNGSVGFEDAASGARLMLQKLAFSGDIRSLAGQVRGEGTFMAADQPYKFRLSTARPTEAGMRVHLAVDPTERPLAVELDGVVSLEQGAPRFEGSAVVTRPAGVELASGKTVANEPWRIGARVRADARAVLLEQIEAQYGPEERNLHLTGTADLTLGARPALNVVLSGRQMDLDRVLAQQESASRRPLAMLQGFGDSLGEIRQLPFAVHVGIGVDAVTMSGATLQGVRGDFKSAGDAWVVENFELRAPGYTQIALSGRLAGPKSAVEFSGPVSVQSADPKALLTWVQGLELARSSLGPMKLRGDVTVGKDRVIIDGLQATFDRENLEGGFAYEFPHDGRAAKLNATVRAAEFDLDSTLAFVSTAFAGSSFERPREVALSADLGRTTYAGIEAVATKANLRFDAGGLRIEKLSVGDFGGAAINASGLIDLSSAPRGTLTLSVDAKRLDGLAAIVKKLSPEAADALLRHADTVAPARIDASLKADPVAGANDALALGKLAINGTLGRLRLAITGEATGTTAKPDATDVKIKAQLLSNDGALLQMLGLDRLLAPQKPAATLTLAANGPVGGDLRIDAGVTGDGLDAGASGVLRVLGPEAGGKLALAFSAADMRGIKRDSIAFPVFVQSTLALDSGKVVLSDLTGSAGGSQLRGKLTLDKDWRVDGVIGTDSVDLPALVAAAIGAPVPAREAAWSARPFGGTPLSVVSGQIRLEAAQATVAPNLAVEKLRTTVKFSPSEVTFNDIAGALAGGSVSGQASFHTGLGSVFAGGKIAIANSDASKIIRTGNLAPVSGRLSSQLDFDATGSTPAALVGALRGNGSLALENAQIAALDAKAIDGVMRAAERGGPIAEPQVADAVARGMDQGVLKFARATAPIEISTGRARLGKLVVSPATGDFSLSAALDLVEQALDARVTLYATQAAEASQRPEVSVAVKGPLAAPRRSLDVSVLVGWLTLQAVDREAKKLEIEEREVKKRQQLEALLRERAEQAQREREQAQREREQANAPQAVWPQAAAPPTGAPTAVTPSAVMPPSGAASVTGSAASAPALPPPMMVAPLAAPPAQSAQAVPPTGGPGASSVAPARKMPPAPRGDRPAERPRARVMNVPLQLTPQ